MAISYTHGASDDLIARARAVRHAVFVVEQQIDPDEEWDDKDHLAVHFVVTDDDRGVDIGTGRMMVIDGAAKLQRIAVLKEYRGRNIGFDLIEYMLREAATEPGVTAAKLSSQCYAIPFYEKLGFKAYGDIYDDAGIPHRDMKRVLHTP